MSKMLNARTETRRSGRIVWKTFAIAGFVALAAAMMPATEARADRDNQIVWTAKSVKGDVTYREGSEARWIPLKLGGLLSAMAELRTGDNGRAELAYEGSTIVAAPNSEFRLPGPTPKGAVYRVSQKVGTFLYKIKHATRDKFEVQTPYLTTIIKGTIFTVLSGAEGASVHVTEGAVFVQPSQGNAGAFVRPGETARVATNSRDKVIMQGKRPGAGTGSDGQDDSRSNDRSENSRGGNGPDNARNDNARGKVKVVFREPTRQVATLGGTDAIPGNGQANGQNKAKGIDKGDNGAPGNAGLGGDNGPGNGNGLGGGNGNAGGNGSGLGGGNGNAGGNGGGLGGGNGNAGGNGGGLGGGNGNAGGNAGLGGGNPGNGNPGNGNGPGSNNGLGGGNPNNGNGGGNGKGRS